MRHRTLAAAITATVTLGLLSCDSSPLAPRLDQLSLEVVSGNGQTGVVGTELAPLIVKVTNGGNPVSGQVLNFRVVSGNGSIYGGTELTDDHGIAQELWTLGTKASEPQRVEVRAVESSTGAQKVFGTFAATALPDKASSLSAIAGNNQTAVAGSTVPIAPSVRVADQYGNPISGVLVDFVRPASGSRTAPFPTTGPDGIATVGGWTLGPATGTNTLVATTFLGLTGDPVTFTAFGTAGNATQLMLLSGNNQTASPGATLPDQPTVRVLDANRNGVPNVAVTFTVTSGGGSIDGVGSVTTLTSTGGPSMPVGSAAVNWTLGSADGANTLQATAVGLSGSPVVFNATGVAFVWVTSFGPQRYSTVPDSVWKINTSTNALIAAIALEPRGSNPLGVAVDESSVWVANDARFTGAYGVSRIDKVTNAILATIPTSQSPAGVAVDQTVAWVTTGNAFDGSSPVLLRIDKSTNGITATIPLPGSSDTYLAVDSNFIWIAGNPDIIKVSKSSLTVVATINVGQGANGIAVDHDAVWVAQGNLNAVRRIRKSDGAVTDLMTGFSNPTGIAVDAGSVWVVNTNGNSVSRIDKATGITVASVPVGTSPFGVSVDQNSVWVANYGSNTVSRVNKATNAIVATIRVGTSPISIGDATGFAFDALFKPVARSGGP